MPTVTIIATTTRMTIKQPPITGTAMGMTIPTPIPTATITTRRTIMLTGTVTAVRMVMAVPTTITTPIPMPTTRSARAPCARADGVPHSSFTRIG